MAVHFIVNGPGTIDGAMLHRADDRDIQVGILHHPSEGYKLGYDGQTIKETLGVREFVERLGVDRHKDRGRGLYHPPHEKLLHDVRQILIIVSSRSQIEIENLADTLNKSYSSLIRNGRLQLAEHTISMKVTKSALYTERESLGNTERSVTQVDWKGVKKQPMTPDEAFRVDDEEIYYSIKASHF